MTAELANAHLLTVAEYLAMEEAAEVRHEYLGGVVYEMPGGTSAHSEVATNTLVTLGAQLRGKPCRPYNSDMKVRIEFPTHTRFYYPDAIVVCERGSPKSVYLDRPVLIVEVASDSTRRTDEQEKRDAYFMIPTLRAYVMLEQDAPAAIVWRRGERGFQREAYGGLGAVVELPEIGLRLPLADVYEAVTFSFSGPALAERET